MPSSSGGVDPPPVTRGPRRREQIPTPFAPTPAQPRQGPIAQPTAAPTVGGALTFDPAAAPAAGANGRSHRPERHIERRLGCTRGSWGSQTRVDSVEAQSSTAGAEHRGDGQKSR